MGNLLEEDWHELVILQRGFLVFHHIIPVKFPADEVGVAAPDVISKGLDIKQDSLPCVYAMEVSDDPQDLPATDGPVDALLGEFLLNSPRLAGNRIHQVLVLVVGVSGGVLQQSGPEFCIERRLFASIRQRIERDLRVLQHIDPSLSLVVVYRGGDDGTGYREEPGVVLLRGFW